MKLKISLLFYIFLILQVKNMKLTNKEIANKSNTMKKIKHSHKNHQINDIINYPGYEVMCREDYDCYILKPVKNGFIERCELTIKCPSSSGEEIVIPVSIKDTFQEFPVLASSSQYIQCNNFKVCRCVMVPRIGLKEVCQNQMLCNRKPL